MCEAFSSFFGNTYLWYPNSQNPDIDISNVDPFDFYYISPVFKLVSFPSLSNLSIIDKSSWFWYRITNIIFSATIASVLLISQLFHSRRIIFVRDVGVLKITSFLKKVKLLKDTIIFEAHVFDPRHCKYLKSVDGLVVINNHLADLYGHISVPILVVHDGVRIQNFNNFEISKCFDKSQSEKKVVLYLGNFFEWKGVYTLAEAAKLSEATIEYWFVGGSHDTYKEFCYRVSGIENVKIFGHVDKKKTLDFFSKADLLVIPNSAKDPMSFYTSPLKLFEYMAARKPIIASRLPSLQEILRDGENAILFNPDDPKDLAEKIMWALENDCSKIVDQAWQDVQEYTWDKRAEKIVRWMEELGTFDHKGITSLSNQGELP